MHYEKVGDGEPVCIEDELPFGLPEGWCWARLATIANVVAGSTPPKSSFCGPDGVPYFKMYNLRNREIDFDYQPQFICRETHEDKLARSIIRPGDVVMNIVGPPLGKVAIIPDRFPEANTNQAAVVIHPYDSDSLNKWLYYYLQEMTEINTIMTRGSAGQVNISLTQSKQMRIAIPPNKALKRILQALDDLLARVDTIEREQAELDELLAKTRSKVLDLAIRGKLVSQDPADEPASVLLERIHQEKLQMVADGKLKKKDVAGDSVIYRGDDNSYYEKVCDSVPICLDDELPFKLPEGWAWSRLSSVLGTLLSGSDLKPHQYNAKCEGMPYMTGASNVMSGTLVVNRWTTEAKNISVAGDLLLTCKGTIGLTAINNIGSLHIARQFMALRTVGTGSSLQVTAYLKIILLLIAPMLAQQSMGLIPGIDRKTVLDILIALPPFDEQCRIVDTFNSILPLLLDSEGV